MKNKKRKLAEKLIELLGSKENRKRLTEELVKAHGVPLLGVLMTDAINENLDSLMTAYIDKYEKQCSKKLLKALVKFYRSPVGQEFISGGPALDAELAQVGNAWTETVLQTVINEFQKLGLGLKTDPVISLADLPSADTKLH